MVDIAQEKKIRKNNQNAKKIYTFAVGRRKSAVARVRLYPVSGKVQINGAEYKKGDIVINGKPINEYFRFIAYKPEYNQVFKDANAEDKYVFSVRVTGGGLAGQLEAVVHGVARVLEKFDKETYRSVLKTKGYLTRDARIRERRKPGTGGKARRKKQSPKR